MPHDEVDPVPPAVVLGLSGAVTGGGASDPNRPVGVLPTAPAPARIRAGMRPGPVLRPRVLVRGDVTFEPPRDPPSTAADLTHGWETAPDEEPAARGFRAGPEWQPLLRPVASMIEDWPGPPTRIYVENLAGTERQTRPTPEEVAQEAATVLELGVGGPDGRVVPFAVIRPARGMYLEPAAPTFVRCPAGPCRGRLVALPPDYAPAPAGEGGVPHG